MNKAETKALVKAAASHEVVVQLTSGNITSINIPHYVNADESTVTLLDGQEGKVEAFLKRNKIVIYRNPSTVTNIIKPLKAPFKGSTVSLANDSLVDDLEALSSELDNEAEEDEGSSKSIADLMAGSESSTENSES